MYIAIDVDRSLATFVGFAVAGDVMGSMAGDTLRVGQTEKRFDKSM